MTRLSGDRTAVRMIGLYILVTPFLGHLDGPAMARRALLLTMMWHMMPGVAETRLRLNLCLRCLWMTLTRSSFRNLIWNLKFSVFEALGLHARVVLPSRSPLRVLCSLGKLVLLTGHSLVQITGPGRPQLLRVPPVGCDDSAIALFICDRWMLPILATRQLILLMFNFPLGSGLGSTMFILSILRAVPADTTRTCLWRSSVLLTMWMHAIMLWQALQIELKTSVWVGVLVLFIGVGMLVIMVLSSLWMFLFAPLDIWNILDGL